jgi:hypothetical protein
MLIKYEEICIAGDKHYRLLKEIKYYSERYNRFVTVPVGFVSDGATGAFDISSKSWWVHDKLCKECIWDDGTPATNWQASWVLSDILYSENRGLRSFYWGWMSFIAGCKKCQQNGMFRRFKQFKALM